jgi:hypothetical protein
MLQAQEVPMSVSASQVQKIMRGSALARHITSVLVAFGFVVLVFVCISVAMGGIAGQRVSVGPYVFSPAALQAWSARLYVILITLIGGGLAMASLLLIRAVFTDLARGNIFCDANVRRIRNLGWLTIAGGILWWLIPVADAAYFMLTGHDGITFRDQPTLFGGLGQMVTGGLYLLASWIMAVGLGVREDAEEMRRDAELVI